MTCHDRAWSLHWRVAFVAAATIALVPMASQAEPAATAAPSPTPAASPLATEQQKLDYTLGVQLGRNLRNMGVEVDPELLVQGLRDALAGKRLLLSETELRQSMMAMRAESRQGRVRTFAVASDENYKLGEAFRADYAKKSGVVATSQGMLYKVVKQGAGRVPREGDSVEVRYRGTLVDGTEFDSSSRSDGPATFAVKASLPGWRQALLQMPVGSTWEVVLPPKLAFGARGNGLNVGPQATVIFELELVAIRAADVKGKPALD
jgi:FKBP-type peptidyl-prolyl cis-trans isomerase FklB